MKKPILFIAIGNPGCGDDALAHEFLSHLQTSKHSNFERVEFLFDIQLQIEHILDLKNRQTILFVDASVSCKPPFEFARITAKRDMSYSSHAVSPASLLHIYQKIQNTPAPNAFLLSIKGIQFELGKPLSLHALSNLNSAVDFMQDLLETTAITQWQNRRLN